MSRPLLLGQLRSRETNSLPRRHRLKKRRLEFDFLERRDLLSANVIGDFNGDGFDDMAFGVPDEQVGLAQGGAVNVVYGSAGAGLSSSGNQFWSQDSSAILNVAQDGDEFGYSLAAGDFNGDGNDDLAVGVPGETIGGFADAGAVTVIYGSATGLNSSGNQLWSQDNSGILDFAEPSDRFGATVAAGDFNNDGIDDLAVGAPNEDYIKNNPGIGADAGVVHVLFGVVVTGLTSTGNQFWSQDSSGIVGQIDGGEEFGFSLVSGDFNGDQRDDLAIGAPGDTVSSQLNAGTVNTIYGSASGLDSTGNQLWSQDSSGILDVSESGDRFGTALAAGDLNGNGTDDLAVGVPQEDLGLITDAGAVNVLYGSGTGLSSDENQFWNQDSSGILDEAELNAIIGTSNAVGDNFGAALQIANFNGDESEDLAVGVPGETIGTSGRAGAVNVIYGQLTIGLRSAGNQFWHQDESDVLDSVETDDRFGSTIAVGDFNNDGRFDVVIGVPGESVESRANPGTFVTNAGAANALYGSLTGLTAVGNQIWHQNTTGILDECELDDAFASALLNSIQLVPELLPI